MVHLRGRLTSAAGRVRTTAGITTAIARQLWRVATGRAAAHLVDPDGGTRIILDFRRGG